MIMPFNEPSCETCKHYRPIETSADSDDYKFAKPVDIGEYGKCTRYPPRFFYQGLVNAEFPVVQCDEVCGEYQPTVK